MVTMITLRTCMLSSLLSSMGCTMHGIMSLYIIIETYFLAAIHLIKHQSPSFHSFVTIVASIKSLLALQWEIHIIHTLRDTNVGTDILVKKEASTNVSLVMLELCPDDVLPCVIAYALERVLYACNSCVFFSSLIKRNIYNIFMHQRSIEVCNIKISPSMTMLKKHYILTKKCGKYKNLTSYNIFLYFKLNFKRI